MKRSAACAATAAALVLLAGCRRDSGTAVQPAEGPVGFANIQAVRLAAPTSKETADYLGLAAGGGEFALTDVSAPVLVVQLFDMYCQNCQKDAPDVNLLYDKVLSSDLKDRVRFLGIGKGNTPTEVSVYEERYGVKFPLFPDPDKINTKRLGEKRTPYFVVVDTKAKKVVHQRWRVDGVESLFARLQGVGR